MLNGGNSVIEFANGSKEVNAMKAGVESRRKYAQNSSREVTVCHKMQTYGTHIVEGMPNGCCAVVMVIATFVHSL